MDEPAGGTKPQGTALVEVTRPRWTGQTDEGSGTVEDMIEYIEEITGLTMKVETASEASWGMKVLDNTRRKALGGPCRVHWKDGIRTALAARHPDALKS